MQPYFAPYLGYLSLIKNSDCFILLDEVQFIRHGWIERNRILKENDGWLYIQVPLKKHNRETLIKDILINNDINWKNKILAQLVPYKKKAPYYNDVISLLNVVFENEYNSIVYLNKLLLENICKYLNIYKKLFVFSDMNLNINEPTTPDEWALNICKTLKGDISYLNPIGGIDLFDKKKYIENGININFHKINLNPYNQKRVFFEPGLSIIDVLMFNHPDDINILLDQFELS